MRGTTSEVLSVGPAYRKIGKYEFRATCIGAAPITINVDIRKISTTNWINVFQRIPIKR